MSRSSVSSPKYKLTYFNARWLAEPIRFLLSYAGEEFEDVRLELDEWQKGSINKSAYPYGKLPCLEVKGTNVRLSQSLAIARYLAKKYNLAGTTDLEAAKCDEYADCVKDIMGGVDTMWTDDEKKKEEAKRNLLEKVFPTYFSVIESDLKGNGGKFLVGKSLTWIDFLLAHFTELFELYVDKNTLANYPAIKSHQKHIFNLPQIKTWIAKRPVTEL